MARSASARQRARRYAKKSGVYATNAGDVAAGGSGNSRDGVLAAAAVFAEKARANAAKFSTRIPAATFVKAVDEQQALVMTAGNEAPNAAPFEFRERHPLWGDRKHWYAQPLRAYMSNAARNAATQSKAADAYGDAETKQLAKEFGYTH